MKRIINPQVTLLAVGILQPVTAQELVGFIRTTFNNAGTIPGERDLRRFLESQESASKIASFKWNGRRLYSLTAGGSLYLLPEQRRLRDKLRAYLLRDAHRRRIVGSRTGPLAGLVGDSPTVDTSTSMKGRAANKFALRSYSRASQIYWPRASRQFRSEAGPAWSVRDTLPPLVSFDTSKEAGLASGSKGKVEFDCIGLATCLGLSPALLSRMAHKGTRYYRVFPLKKKGGGTRTIRSPRIFLKVVQWYLAEFVLRNLKTSRAVHSFLPTRSIVTNALQHENRRYVANIDIEDFFGSITRRQVRDLLRREDFTRDESAFISRLVTYEDCLPQGAPTSPTLSNAILYEFDEDLRRFALRRDVSYSRYADDITFSGNHNSAILECIDRAQRRLKRLHFNLNASKTRIASRGGQQRVTGVVVNEQAAPPRVLRRKIRAIFHQASLRPDEYSERIAELGGHIGFLRQFPKIECSVELRGYRSVLRVVRELARRRGARLRALADDS